MTYTIQFNPLDPKSIDQAIKKIEDYKLLIDKKIQNVMDKLREFGFSDLNAMWNGAIYDGIDATQISYNILPNGFEITASGSQVLFIEFGAGVYYNPGGNRNYPGEEPPSLIPIGEYGNKQGRKEGWYFNGAGGREYTHGNPANAIVWNTGEMMAQEVVNILRGEFS